MTEEREWTRSQFERCPDCGWDPRGIADDELAAAVVHACEEWPGLLTATADARLRHRPDPSVWSALEYACHVRDLIEVFRVRIERMRLESDAELGWWDHEASVQGENYAGQDPDRVGRDIVTNGRVLAGTLEDLRPDGWDRSAVRRPGEAFTIRGSARFVVHEIVHHHRDAKRVVVRVEP